MIHQHRVTKLIGLPQIALATVVSLTANQSTTDLANSRGFDAHKKVKGRKAISSD